jgi:hypothetical protein
MATIKEEKDLKKTARVTKPVPRRKPDASIAEMVVKANEDTKRIESIAMMQHVHNPGLKISQPKKNLADRLRLKRLGRYIESDPTIWGVVWSFLWRGLILYLIVSVGYQMAVSMLTTLLTLYLKNT